jgi:hypothetical protein
MNSLSFPNYGSDNAEGKIENINHIVLGYMSYFLPPEEYFFIDFDF